MEYQIWGKTLTSSHHLFTCDHESSQLAFVSTFLHDQTWQVFLNICHSDKIKEASGKDRPDKSGTEWDIPYSLGPPVKEVDKGSFSKTLLLTKDSNNVPKRFNISITQPSALGRVATCHIPYLTPNETK